MCLSAACGGGEAPVAPAGADLSSFRTARIQVDGVPFEVWMAETAAQQMQGLMNATADQLAPLPDGAARGRLFVFPSEQVVSFFMRDTFVALDLAHFRADGSLVETHMLVPLDETPVVSGQAVRYALEVPAGTLADRGIAVGATLALPLP